MRSIGEDLVASYLAVVEHLEDGIEELADLVLDRPGPPVLKQLGKVKNDLLEARRVLADAACRIPAPPHAKTH